MQCVGSRHRSFSQHGQRVSSTDTARGPRLWTNGTFSRAQAREGCWRASTRAAGIAPRSPLTARQNEMDEYFSDEVLQKAKTARVYIEHLYKVQGQNHRERLDRRARRAASAPPLAPALLITRPQPHSTGRLPPAGGSDWRLS